MEEEEDNVSDSTVLLTDFFHNPDKVAVKRRRLAAKHGKEMQTSVYTKQHEDMTCNDLIDINKDRPPGPSLTGTRNNRVDKQWHLKRYFDSVDLENNHYVFNSDELRIKRELLKQENNEEDVNNLEKQDFYNVIDFNTKKSADVSNDIINIYNSDDDCEVSEIVNKGGQNRLLTAFNETKDEGKNSNARIIDSSDDDCAVSEIINKGGQNRLLTAFNEIKDEGKNSNARIIDSSDYDCAVSEIINKGGQNRLLVASNEIKDEDINSNARIIVVRPSVINARRKTICSFERNDTVLKTNDLVRSVQQNKKDDKIKVLKPSDINTRRVTIDCSRNEELSNLNKIKYSERKKKLHYLNKCSVQGRTEKKDHRKNVTEISNDYKAVAENLSEFKIDSKIVFSENIPEPIPYQVNVTDSLGYDICKKTSFSTTTNNNCVTVGSRLTGDVRSIGISSIFKSKGRNISPTSGNVDNHANEKTSRKEINFSDNDYNIERQKEFNKSQNKTKTDINEANTTIGTSKAVNTDENACEITTAFTVELNKNNLSNRDEHNNADNISGNNNQTENQSKDLVNTYAKANKRKCYDHKSPNKIKRFRKEEQLNEDSCQSIGNNVEKLDNTDMEQSKLYTNTSKVERYTRKSNEGKDKLINKQNINEASDEHESNDQSVHGDSNDERNSSNRDEKIERIIKFQVGFCTLIKEHLKEYCENDKVDERKIVVYLNSANSLTQQIENLKALASSGSAEGDIFFTCPRCTFISTYSANVLFYNKEYNSKKIKDRIIKCPLCHGIRKVYNRHIEKYLQLVKNKKDNMKNYDPNGKNDNEREGHGNSQKILTLSLPSNVANNRSNCNSKDTVDKYSSKDASIIIMPSIVDNYEDSIYRGHIISTNSSSIDKNEANHIPESILTEANTLTISAVDKLAFTKMVQPIKLPTSNNKDETNHRDSGTTEPCTSTVCAVNRHLSEATSVLNMPTTIKDKFDLNRRVVKALAETNPSTIAAENRCPSNETSVLKITPTTKYVYDSDDIVVSDLAETNTSTIAAEGRQPSEETSVLNTAPITEDSDDSNHKIYSVPTETTTLTIAVKDRPPGEETLVLKIIPTTKDNDDSNRKVVSVPTKTCALTITPEARRPSEKTSVLNITPTTKDNDDSNNLVVSVPTETTTSTITSGARRPSEETSALNLTPTTKDNGDSNHILVSVPPETNSSTIITEVRCSSEEPSALNVNSAPKGNDILNLKVISVPAETNASTYTSEDRPSEKTSVLDMPPVSKYLVETNRKVDSVPEGITTSITAEAKCRSVGTAVLNMLSISKYNDTSNHSNRLTSNTIVSYDINKNCQIQNTDDSNEETNKCLTTYPNLTLKEMFSYKISKHIISTSTNEESKKLRADSVRNGENSILTEDLSIQTCYQSLNTIDYNSSTNNVSRESKTNKRKANDNESQPDAKCTKSNADEKNENETSPNTNSTLALTNTASTTKVPVDKYSNILNVPSTSVNNMQSKNSVDKVNLSVQKRVDKDVNVQNVTPNNCETAYKTIKAKDTNSVKIDRDIRNRHEKDINILEDSEGFKNKELKSNSTSITDKLRNENSHVKSRENTVGITDKNYNQKHKSDSEEGNINDAGDNTSNPSTNETRDDRRGETNEAREEYDSKNNTEGQNKNDSGKNREPNEANKEEQSNEGSTEQEADRNTNRGHGETSDEEESDDEPDTNDTNIEETKTGNDTSDDDANTVLNKLEDCFTKIKKSSNVSENEPTTSVPKVSNIESFESKLIHLSKVTTLNEKDIKAEFEYICHICSCIYTYRVHFQKHMRKNHNLNYIKVPEDRITQKCVICGDPIQKKAYNLHLKKCSNQTVMNNDINTVKHNYIVTTKKRNAQDDKEGATSQVDRKYIYKCLKCEVELSTDYATRKHRKDKHRDMKSKKLFEKILIVPENGRKNRKSYEKIKPSEEEKSASIDEEEDVTSDDHSDEKNAGSNVENKNSAANYYNGHGTIEEGTNSEENTKENITNKGNENTVNDEDDFDEDNSDEQDASSCDENSRKVHDEGNRHISCDEDSGNDDSSSKNYSSSEKKNCDKEHCSRKNDHDRPNQESDSEYSDKDEINKNSKESHQNSDNRNCTEERSDCEDVRNKTKPKNKTIDSNKDQDNWDDVDAGSHVSNDSEINIDEREKTDRMDQSILSCDTKHLEGDKIRHTIDDDKLHSSGDNSNESEANDKCNDRTNEKFTSDNIGGQNNANCEEQDNVNCHMVHHSERHKEKIMFANGNSNEAIEELEPSCVKRNIQNVLIDNEESIRQDHNLEFGHQMRCVTRDKEEGKTSVNNGDNGTASSRDDKKILQDISMWQDVSSFTGDKERVETINANDYGAKNKMKYTKVTQSNKKARLTKYANCYNCYTNIDLITVNEHVCTSILKRNVFYNCYSCGVNVLNNEKHTCSTNENNYSIEKVRISEVVSIKEIYVFSCNECAYTTDISDNVIRHCQNHYNQIEDPTTNCAICQLNFETDRFEAHHNFHEKNIRVIYYSYTSLFFNWDRIFINAPLDVMKEIKAHSMYATHCVKMAIAENGPWQYSLYQCAQCSTCVPPSDVERHTQGECSLINNPCGVCDRSFTTDEMRVSHEFAHEIGIKLFRVVVFNDIKDKAFNFKLMDARRKIRQQENLGTEVQKAVIYKCQCGLCFISKDNFKIHFVGCDPGMENGALCHKCTAPLLFLPVELENHLALHHDTIKYEFVVRQITFQQVEHTSDINCATVKIENPLQPELNEAELYIKRELMAEENKPIIISDDED